MPKYLLLKHYDRGRRPSAFRAGSIGQSRNTRGSILFSSPGVREPWRRCSS